MREQRMKLLRFFAAHERETAEWPSLAEIQIHMGWKNKAGFYDACSALVRYGFLKRVGRRQWQITDAGRTALCAPGHLPGPSRET